MMVVRRVVLIAFVAAALAGCGQGLPPAGNYASVSGQVVDAASSAGIASATVSINGGVESAATDASGRFAIKTVPTGDWDYTVTAAGYRAQNVLNPPPLGPGETRTITITLTHG
jgi:predicted small lipoprotein YifL